MYREYTTYSQYTGGLKWKKPKMMTSFMNSPLLWHYLNWSFSILIIAHLYHNSCPSECSWPEWRRKDNEMKYKIKKRKNWLQYEVYKRRIFSPRASLWFWNLGASCCNLPVEVAEGVEPFCERRSTLLWICRLFPASEDITLPNILESCSLSWGHATSLYVMSTSLQIKQIFFADLPDSKGAHPCTSSSGQGGGKRVLEDFF